MHKLDLIANARDVADHAAQGHITEDLAVHFLADNAALSDVEYIRAAVIRAKTEPDLSPLAVALLERALERASNPPPPRRARLRPDASRLL